MNWFIFSCTFSYIRKTNYWLCYAGGFPVKKGNAKNRLKLSTLEAVTCHGTNFWLQKERIVSYAKHVKRHINYARTIYHKATGIIST